MPYFNDLNLEKWKSSEIWTILKRGQSYKVNHIHPMELLKIKEIVNILVEEYKRLF